MQEIIGPRRKFMTLHSWYVFLAAIQVLLAKKAGHLDRTCTQ
jgi:hypothetical protein